MTTPPTDEREATLVRYRLYAGSLLVLAAAVWVATHYLPLPPVPLGYVRAAAEAAMVGGIADWFAVTALFRHPLGLPIPHTRLIPRNQARIADGVAAYIDREFLQHDVLVSRLQRFDIAERISRLLDSEDTRRKLVDGLMRFLPRMLDERAQPGVLEAVATAIRSGLASSNIRPAIARLVRHAVNHPDFGRLVDDFLERGIDWLEENRDEIRERVGARSYWFVPRFVDRHIADKTVGGVTDLLEALEDPASPERAEFDRWLATLPDSIERAEGGFERLPEVIKRILDHPDTSHIVAGALTTLKNTMLADLQDPQSRIRLAFDTVAKSLADQLDSLALRRDINAAVEAFFTENVPAWREEVRGFIVETLNRQQPEAFARRIELQVGKDLQFIRINGTIFGGLVGAGIHFVNRLLGG
ncbi:MAG: DUF445 domain-containing protein [Alphaproteobacteria bacterium]|nr:DUF445 domain-containing protein [Alphaproteobacteria bacterium]